MTTVQGSPRVTQQRSERSHSVASQSFANDERSERRRLTSSISSSPSPSSLGKRLHPTSLNIDDGAPPNKRIPTPSKEEKESIMREKAILYKRLAEAEKNPFFQPTIFPFLPFNAAAGKFSPVPPLYTLIQQQSPPRPSSSSVPSPYNLSSGIGAAVNVTPVVAQPGSVVNSSLGISGLPTPGGSSVGSVSTPPRPSYPSQFYPLMKYPFSPPTPSSLSGLSLLSPFNANSVNGEGQVNPASNTATAAAADRNTAKILASSTPKEGHVAARKGDGQKEPPKGKTQKSGNIPPATHIVNGTWPAPTAIAGGSVPSPLSYFHHPSPLSPMMFIQSPYPNSVSSCISVSSSSGCSSSSETTVNVVMDGSDASTENDASRVPTTRQKRYAPSEYHVGPHRPWSEKVVDEDNQSEGADNSGRNTPVDTESVAENTVNPGDLSRVSHNLMLSTSAGPQFSGGPVLTPGAVSAAQPTTEAGYIQPGQPPSQGHTLYPLSVESLRSSSVNHQGYLSNSHSTTSVERPSSGVSSMSSSVSSRGSTPEPDDLKPDPSHLPQGSDTFCLVPGRLSLLSSTQKYKVTVDEVRRRLSHPECLNASVLGGILRRAKSKNGGHVLRQRLESIGVSLPPGRRKATELSLLTSLVEGESLHLATDFRRLCNNFFPHSELAQIIARQHAGTPEAQHRISMVKATHLIVSELQAMLNAVGGPSNIRPNDPNNPYPGLTNFGLVTHGFGNPAINTSLNVLQTYLQDLLAYYEGRKPIPPQDGSGRYSFGTASTPAPPPTQQQPTNSERLHGSGYNHRSGHPGRQTEGTLSSGGNRGPLSSSDVAITAETSARELVSSMGVVLKQEPVDPTSG